MRTSRKASERMGLGLAIAVGAGLGLALGILVSVTTDLPLAPEAGLTLGALLGRLTRRHRARSARARLTKRRRGRHPRRSGVR
jgi:hypothetical protein